MSNHDQSPKSARHYLDHASTSPLRKEVLDAMLECLSGPCQGDPGRIYAEGQAGRAAVENAREEVAYFLGVRPRQIVFTSSATEAINTAVWSAKQVNTSGGIVCLPIEHSSVQNVSKRFSTLVQPEVDHYGRANVDSFKQALDEATNSGDKAPPLALAHCQWGNHEIGTVEPVEEIVAACKDRGVPIHVDATQAMGHLKMDLGQLDADFTSLSVHKCGGPKGVGALIVKKGARLHPLIVGGEQERMRRAGMENTPAIVGFGALCKLLSSDNNALLNTEIETAYRQTQKIIQTVSEIGGVRLFGHLNPNLRLCHIVCLGIDEIEAEGALLALDKMGIAVHSGSACSSESAEPSPVLQAIGADAKHSLRISVGHTTTQEDITALCDALAKVIANLRKLSAYTVAGTTVAFENSNHG